jgi:hypothetical protein
MKKLRRVASIATLFMLFFGRAHAAQLINMNFISLDGAPMIGPAVAGSVGDYYWNETPTASLADYNTSYATPPLDPTTPFRLTDSTGTLSNVYVTGFSFNDSNQTGVGAFDSTPYASLMTGFVLANGYMNLTGLEKNASYNLYVYSQTNIDTATSPLTINANGAEFSTSGNDGTPNTFQSGANGNYIVHTVTTDASGNLNLVFSSASANAAINGLQIQAVPEPQSVMLLGVGGVLVFAYLRLKTNESII